MATLRYCLLLVLILGGTNYLFAQETYPLKWRFEKGQTSHSRQIIDTETSRTLLQKDLKTPKQPAEVSKVSARALIYWQCPEIMPNQDAVVTIMFRKGFLEYTKGKAVITCDVESPKDVEKLQTPAFKPYLHEVKDGIAFMINLKDAKVKATWILKQTKQTPGKDKQTKVQYERELVEGIPDRFNMESAFKQLPNKDVPVGHEWQLLRSYEVTSFEYRFKFAKIETVKGQKIATIEITGEIKKAGKKVGTIKGTYYLSLALGVMFQQKLTETMEEIYPTPGVKDVGGMQVKTIREISVDLINTNVKPKK